VKEQVAREAVDIIEERVQSGVAEPEGAERRLDQRPWNIEPAKAERIRE
jgi:hypothetical protein